MEILIQYKEIICIVLAFVFEVVLIFAFKKNPKVIDNSFLVHLCDWIMDAELTYKVGADKLAYVLNMAKDYLGDSYVESDVKKLVEYVLTLPEKKGK